MARPLSLALAILVVAGSASAQQSGTVNRDYVIDGVGSFAPSFVSHAAAAPGVIRNDYSTLDPGAPVIWAFATSGTTGWFTTPTNSVDIGPGGLAFMLDGTNIFTQNPLNFFAITNGAGTFTINVGTHVGLIGFNAYLAMGHAAASSPDGFWVSQTHLIAFAADPAACTGSGTPLFLFDDDSLQQPLGFSFPFYGTNYTECYVGSNGYVTFVAPDTTFTESVPLFLSGPPRIAEIWNDFDPSSGGTVTFFTNNLDTFEVCYNGVPEYFTSNSNSFRVKGVAGNLVEMGYSASVAFTSGLVGLSPGNNIDPVGLSLNLSAGPHTVAANQAPYELFGGGSFDLQGVLITWVLDPTGNPVGMF